MPQMQITTADVSAIKVTSAPHQRAALSIIGHDGQLLGEVVMNWRIWQRIATLGEQATFRGGMGECSHMFQLGKDNDPS